MKIISIKIIDAKHNKITKLPKYTIKVLKYLMCFEKMNSLSDCTQNYYKEKKQEPILLL